MEHSLFLETRKCKYPTKIDEQISNLNKLFLVCVMIPLRYSDIENNFLVINAHAHLTPTAHLTPSLNPKLVFYARALIGQLTVYESAIFLEPIFRVNRSIGVLGSYFTFNTDKKWLADKSNPQNRYRNNAIKTTSNVLRITR